MKRWLLGVFVTSVLLGCKEEAQVPVYIEIPEFENLTNYSTQGTGAQDFTTAWLQVNGEYIGAYEIPATVPVLASGSSEINIHPGVNLNGQASYRFWYSELNPHTETLDLVPGKTYSINSGGSGLSAVTYKDNATIELVEDFEGTGINLEPSGLSDTVMLRTNDPSEVFKSGISGEPQEFSGKMVVRPQGLGEVSTIAQFDLPKFGANVILEIHYKTDVSFTVGLYVDQNTQVVQTPVVSVYPTEEWKKMYINLVTEVSAYPNANGFKIFFGALNPYDSDRTVYIDNLKIIY